MFLIFLKNVTLLAYEQSIIAANYCKVWSR